MSFKDRMARAEDYVFGLMDEHERARAERDMEVDAEFRDCVMVLGERLRKLHRAKGPLPMSDDTWDEITARISDMPQMGRKEVAARMAAMGVPSPDDDRKGLLRIKRPGAHQFAGWRGTVVAGALVAAVVVGYLAGQASAPAPQPVAVTLLQDENGARSAMLETYGNYSLRFLPLSALDVPAGKVLQLWTWRNGAPAPLGTFDGSSEITFQGPELPAAVAGQVYEITLEDAPGSTTGEPAGVTLLSGEAITPPR